MLSYYGSYLYIVRWAFDMFDRYYVTKVYVCRYYCTCHTNVWLEVSSVNARLIRLKLVASRRLKPRASSRYDPNLLRVLYFWKVICSKMADLVVPRAAAVTTTVLLFVSKVAVSVCWCREIPGRTDGWVRGCVIFIWNICISVWKELPNGGVFERRRAIARSLEVSIEKAWSIEYCQALT